MRYEPVSFCLHSQSVCLLAPLMSLLFGYGYLLSCKSLTCILWPWLDGFYEFLVYMPPTDSHTHTYCRRTRLKDCQLIFIARISSFFLLANAGAKG